MVGLMVYSVMSTLLPLGFASAVAAAAARRRGLVTVTVTVGVGTGVGGRHDAVGGNAGARRRGDGISSAVQEQHTRAR